jgi:hypothetical protein
MTRLPKCTHHEPQALISRRIGNLPVEMDNCIHNDTADTAGTHYAFVLVADTENFPMLTGIMNWPASPMREPHMSAQILVHYGHLQCCALVVTDSELPRSRSPVHRQALQLLYHRPRTLATTGSGGNRNSNKPSRMIYGSSKVTDPNLPVFLV